jgi:tetratricopeptide (TPR) repeat protein
MKRILPLLSLALLMSWGCFLRKSSVTPPAPPAPAAAPAEVAAPPAVTPPPIAIPPAPLESAPIAKTITTPSSLEVGELNFQIGNYLQAIRAYDAYLGDNPKSKDRDKALFHLGLSRALANDQTRNLRRAEAAFRRLILEFPDSIYKNQAEFILGLQGQIEKLRTDVKERDEKIRKLSEELQVLKEIDMQRRPSRPKE